MKRMFAVTTAAALMGMLAFSGSALALRPGCDAPPCGGGGGNDPGGGGPPEGEAAQNLSVPAILVGSLGTLSCGADEENASELVSPEGTPLTGYEYTGDFWVQKVHTWQAQCFYADDAEVFGAWGDNLSGDAKLKVGSPIRVEIVLTNATVGTSTLQGYDVMKLEPSTLDRLSDYGHLAGGDEIGGWTDMPIDFDPEEWVVHDAEMQLSVENLDTREFVVPLQQISPEINATGKIVYGYNLRVSEPGAYEIRFNTSEEVTFIGVDAGEYDNDNAYLEITVVPGGGQGGGKPQR